MCSLVCPVVMNDYHFSDCVSVCFCVSSVKTVCCVVCVCDSGRRRLQRVLQGIRLARVHQAVTPRIPQDFKTIKT